MTSPQYIDVSDRIHHVRTETERERSLSEIQHQVVHYLAGPPQSPVMTEAQEISLLLSLATFHQQRDFGGGFLGRTLEYTYAIALSGRIYRVNRESLITWSHRNGNRVGMSTVLLIGVGQSPSAEMLATLRAHLDYTASREDVNVLRQRTWAHGETRQIYGGGPDWGNSTDCCGRAQPWVKQYREEIPMPDPTPQPGANTEFFVETGHNLSNAFRDYWHANGGLAEFGFPISEEEAGSAYPFSALPELAGYTVQMFERKLLIYKADVGVHDDARLGALALAISGDGQHGCAC